MDINIDIDKIVTDLNGKADVDLANVNNAKGVLLESYVNGTSWYRVYSDGWCEQGGIATTSNTTIVNSYKNTIIFLKPFKDANYTFTATGVSNDDSSYYQDSIHESSLEPRSSTQITVTHESVVTRFNWQASGYIR